MFGEISIWGWMGAAIMFGIGGGTGFFISRQLKDKRTLELEEKLASARNELAGYRGDVNQHFLKTSLLLGKLTNDYREVYEHLATGAQKLCNEKPNTPALDLPETKILPATRTVELETDTLDLATDEAVVEETPVTNESSTEQNIEISAEEAKRPAPEDVPNSEDNDDDVHLGAESAPSVDNELHKTHSSIH